MRNLPPTTAWKIRIGFTLCGLAFLASLWLVHHQGQVSDHRLCVGLNEVRADAKGFVLDLAVPAPTTPHDSPADRARIELTNRYRATIRARAERRFKGTDC